MRRRIFCRTLAVLPLGALLAACDRPRVVLPVLPAGAEAALRGKAADTIVATLLGTPWAGETPPRLTAGYSIREQDPAGPVAVTVAFYPNFHRVAYAIFGTVEEATPYYATAAAALHDDPHGPAVGAPGAPYPATALFYADQGHGLILVGPVLVRVIAANTNRALFTALLSASVAHLNRALGDGATA